MIGPDPMKLIAKGGRALAPRGKPMLIWIATEVMAIVVAITDFPMTA
jgi:hypothetical protein